MHILVFWYFPKCTLSYQRYIEKNTGGSVNWVYWASNVFVYRNGFVVLCTVFEFCGDEKTCFFSLIASDNQGTYGIYPDVPFEL